MNKKFFGFVLAVGLAATLGACQGGDSNNSPSPTSSPAATTTPRATTSPAATTAPASPAGSPAGGAKTPASPTPTKSP